MRHIVSSTLSSLGLLGFEERFTHQLSGGEKRLVSLATMLAMDPEVLILDEPTAGLDEETVERLVEVLRDSKIAQLVVSHDRLFLEKTADKLFTLNHAILKPNGA